MKYILGTMVGVAQLGELEPKVQWSFAVQRTPDRSLAGTIWMRSKAGRRSAMKYIIGTMVGVAQLVEPWIVIPVVVGSNPITHPKYAGSCGPANRERQKAYCKVVSLRDVLFACARIHANSGH